MQVLTLQARFELRESCEDREPVAECDSVVEDINAAEHERASLAEEIGKRESWIRQDKEQAEVTLFRQEAHRYETQVEEHERILADLRVKFDPAEIAVTALQERLSEIEHRLVDP